MSVFAAVMTAGCSGAIATIQLFSDSDCRIIEKIFSPAGCKQATFRVGNILLGEIHDGDKTIDQVTIGCLQQGSFAIHCHGNPLIVEKIVQLLQSYNVEIVSAEQLLIKIMSGNNVGTIAIEAKLATAKAKTLLGTKIILSQVNGGLSSKANDWLKITDDIRLDEIKADARQILQNSRAAKIIIYGCSAVLTGPANSGKSTLFNLLTGGQKSIVTEIKGTTRDWVSAGCKIGSLYMELIDTAGLDESLSAGGDGIEGLAQQKALELLHRAELVLLVLDGSRDIGEFSSLFMNKIAEKKVVTVLNKSDLPPGINIDRLPESLSDVIQISAKSGIGIEKLKEKILLVTGAAEFNLQQGVCFTDRQVNLLSKLLHCESAEEATSIITELITGRL
jgi:tRNA modification GTPase